MSDEAKKKDNVTALARTDASVIAVGNQWRQATDVAGAVKDFALKRIVNIKGKRYPPVEVWQAVANAFGCVGSAHSVTRVDGGVEAKGEVRRMSDGMVIATGEGFVGDDEKMWADRPEHARRAMAQTRAIGRACRAAFAFVIPLIDSDLQTTPSEEMDFVESEQAQQSSGKTRTESLKERVKAVVGTNVKRPTPPEQVRMSDFGDEPEDAEIVEPGEDSDMDDSNVAWKWGERKGQPISAVAVKDLQWGIRAVTEGLNNPDKAKFHAQDRLYLDALKRELARRSR